MPEFKERLKRLQLPSWMNLGELATLLRAAKRFWEIVYSWLTWPLAQLDPDTCTEPLLNLLAYQRDIHRFNNEPLGLYRKRVKYAFINAKDSGSVAGFIEIFKRLGVGYVEINERQPDIDWDVIILRVSDGQIANNSDLLLQIIRQYGRTCRRYQYDVSTGYQFLMRVGSVSTDYICYHATIPNQIAFIRVSHIGSDLTCNSATLNRINTPNQTYGASLL
ncbi:phage tail protein [Providencia sp. 1709051003]|uniref:phage tail protein n=1 Tax=Providencia sp. 1709051003 TaxID=2603246 RepID=UPI0034D5DBA2